MTAWPEGTRTNTSVLNSTSAAQTIAGHSIRAFGSDGGVRLFNSSPTHLVADITGWFNA